MELAAEGAARGAHEDRQVAATHFRFGIFDEGGKEAFKLPGPPSGQQLDESMIEMLMLLARPFFRPAHQRMGERAAGNHDHSLGSLFDSFSDRLSPADAFLGIGHEAA